MTRLATKLNMDERPVSFRVRSGAIAPAPTICIDETLSGDSVWRNWAARLAARPNSPTASQLKRVGIRIIEWHSHEFLECDWCSNWWRPRILPDGRLPKGYWKCPRGCNHLRARELKVGEGTLIRRINRFLAPEGEKLKKLRRQRDWPDLGAFYTIDVNNNVVVQRHINLEEFARELQQECSSGGK